MPYNRGALGVRQVFADLHARTESKTSSGRLDLRRSLMHNSQSAWLYTNTLMLIPVQ